MKNITLPLILSLFVFCNIAKAQIITVTGHSSAYANQNGVYEISISRPANSQQGDFLLAQIAAGKSDAVNKIIPPAGWVRIREIFSNPYNMSVFSFYKIAGSSEPSSYTFSDSLTAGTLSKRLGAITVYRGVDNATPIHISDGMLQNGGVATVPTPSITTTVNNCMLVTLFTGAGNFAWTPPASNNEQYDTASASGSVSIMSAHSIQSTAGAIQLSAKPGNNANIFMSEILTLLPDPTASLQPYTSVKNNVSIYPNPSSGEFTLEMLSGKTGEVVLRNMLGEEVFNVQSLTLRQAQGGESKVEIVDISHLPNGIYILEVISNGERQMEKIIKQ